MGKNWKDKNGNKKRVLLIDTEDVRNKNGIRNQSSIGNYLTRKQFEKIMHESGSTLRNEKIKDIEFEKVLELIKILNER